MSKIIYYLIQNSEIAMDILNDANNKIWFNNEVERLSIINALSEDSIKLGPFWK